MPKPSAAQTFEGVPSAFQLAKKGRPRVVQNDTVDGATLAKTLNTQILNPLYTRVEALEKHAIIEVRVTTPTPYTGLFPLPIPVPGFTVKSLHLAYLRNNTTNGAPETILTIPQWQYTPSGALTIIGMVLVDAQDYTLRFEVRG